MGDVVFKGSSDFSQLQRDFDKLHAEVIKLREQTGTATTASERSYKKLQDSIDKTAKSTSDFGRMAKDSAAGAIGSIKDMAFSYLSVASALGAVVSALREKEELEKRAKEMTVDAADSQAKMLRMLGPVSSKERQSFIDELKAVAAEANVKGGTATVYNAAASGLSAASGDAKATADAIRAAAAIAPESPEELPALTGGILDIGKATKSKNARENLGYLLSVGQQARVNATDKIARNLAPGLLNVTTFGDSPVEAGAILAGLTQGMMDPEGANSKTAATNLAKQLAEQVKGPGLTSTWKRIEFLRANPGARRQFLDRATIDAGATGAVKQLLGEQPAVAGTTAWDVAQQARKEIKTGAEAAAVTDNMAKGMREVREQALAAEARAMEGAEGRLVNANPEAARAGLYSRENLDKLLKASGAGWGYRTGADMSLQFAQWQGQGERQFKKIVQERIDVLENRTMVPEAMRGRVEPPAPTPEARTQADILRRMLKLQEQQVEEARKGRKAIEASNRGKGGTTAAAVNAHSE